MDKAFVISGFRRDEGESKAVVAVLFAPDPPSVKMLKSMGFHNLQSSEQVKLTGDGPREPTLYYFERTPTVKEVTVAKVAPDGTLSGMEKMQGEPCSIIPSLCGAAADRFINPRGALSVSDFPKPASVRPGQMGIPQSERKPRQGRNQ